MSISKAPEHVPPVTSWLDHFFFLSRLAQLGTICTCLYSLVLGVKCTRLSRSQILKFRVAVTMTGCGHVQEHTGNRNLQVDNCSYLFETAEE